MTMLRATITRSGLTGSGARPLTRQLHATNVRTVMYKKDRPDGTTSQLEWTPKTYAVIGGAILGVAGLYGLMMGKPYKVVGSEASPASITEHASAEGEGGDLALGSIVNPKTRFLAQTATIESAQAPDSLSEAANATEPAHPIPEEISGVTVPAEKLQVAKWGRKVQLQKKHPDVEVWMVHTTAEHESGKRTKIWSKPGSSKLRELCDTIGIPVPDTIGRKGGFVKGLPLQDKTVTIETAGGRDRPEFVYRVVHEGSPFNGLKARGYGRVEADPLWFEILLRKHMHWSCRWPSPFLSVADDIQAALVFYAAHRLRCRKGIKILKSRTDGEHWDHEEQRMFHLSTLRRRLGQSWRPLPDYPASAEYVVTNSIPKECVVETMEPDEVERLYKRRLSEIARGITNRQEYYMGRFDGEKKKKEAEDKSDKDRRRCRGFVPVSMSA
ncbi:hypothetical protein VTK56DRAFT_2308 [Thermocarpiscus australiensis]